MLYEDYVKNVVILYQWYINNILLLCLYYINTLRLQTPRFAQPPNTSLHYIIRHVLRVEQYSNASRGYMRLEFSV